mmetsp:Transcript_25821/g.51796  ORF Transcript_25821/g.51796 Transcript_25821/m.51796 type:complete len:126 (+) Transcript_25821:2118-2495(+)
MLLSVMMIKCFNGKLQLLQSMRIIFCAGYIKQFHQSRLLPLLHHRREISNHFATGSHFTQISYCQLYSLAVDCSFVLWQQRSPFVLPPDELSPLSPKLVRFNWRYFLTLHSKKDVTHKVLQTLRS